MQTNGAKICQAASEQFNMMSEEEWERLKAENGNANVGNKNEEDGYDCPECRNKGWVMKSFFAEEVKYWTTSVAECGCMAVRNSIRNRKKSGLNASGKYTLENYQTKEKWQSDIKDMALAFLADMGRGMWFYIGGQSGAGKTHICTAIADTCIDMGRRAKYVVWSEEFKRIKGLIAKEPEQYQAAMKEISSTPVLYIDDLFKGGRGENGKFRPPTEADIKGAFEIINARYNNPQSITIISSEWMLPEICDLDNAIGGRIAERCGDYIVNLPANRKMNWRLNKMVKY